MPAFDRLLIDPPAEQVVQALSEAVESANRLCRVGLLLAAKLDCERYVAGDFAKQPEGLHLWLADGPSGTTYPANSRQTILGLAWWTTPQGRRLVKIVGRRTAYDDQRHDARFGPPEGGWPPLALIDPASAMLRTRPGQPAELLLLCGCGALGTPQQLGWVGERCGPCHDHQEEHGTPLPQAGPRRWLAPGPLTGLAWAPSGRTIAGVVRYWAKHNMPGEMVFWDVARGEVRAQFPFETHSQIDEVAFVAGGPVAAGGPHYECAVWDLEAGSKLFGHTSPHALECLALTADGRTLAYDDRNGILSCDVTKKGKMRLRWPQRKNWERAEGLAFSPDGQVIAVGREGRRIALIDWDSGEERLLQPEGAGPSHRVRALAFSADGRFLAAGSWPAAGDNIDITPPGFLDVYACADGKPLAAWPMGEVFAVAFSPDGNFLFAGGSDRLLRVYDAASWQPRCVLDGHVGAITSIAFSPDGQTLTTASADGTIRFWPWRRLLGEEQPREQREEGPVPARPKAKRATRQRKRPDTADGG